MDDLPTLISTVLWFVAFGILGVIAVYVMNGGHKAPRPVVPEPVSRVPARVDPPVLQYRKAVSLLTRSERIFLDVLRGLIPPGVLVAIKVRLADIVEPEQTVGSDWQTAAEKLNHRHADFTLCDAATYEVLAVLELEDPVSGRPDTMERDEFFEGALSSVGIPVIRVIVQQTYDIEALETALARCLPKFFAVGTDAVSP
ncbi:MAG TPA: DUF2726 domain-containing protein [Terrimicrobiaceae bacterium]|nr:DUF2726 domain-containing protein [Terrimicrobiaceae bacterium]